MSLFRKMMPFQRTAPLPSTKIFFWRESLTLLYMWPARAVVQKQYLKNPDSRIEVTFGTVATCEWCVAHIAHRAEVCELLKYKEELWLAALGE